MYNRRVRNSQYCIQDSSGTVYFLADYSFGVIAAIVWNLFTWWKGIPSSSSHTLIGGFAGAAIMAHGFDAIQLNIILKIAVFIFWHHL